MTNKYSVSEILEFECEKGPDGTYYPVLMRVIGWRKRINGQRVDDTGAPLKH